MSGHRPGEGVVFYLSGEERKKLPGEDRGRTKVKISSGRLWRPKFVRFC